MKKKSETWFVKRGLAASYKKLLQCMLGASALYMAGVESALAVQPLTVNGNQIAAGGVPASFSGVSLFSSTFGLEKFYNASVVGWLKTDWKASVVRAPVQVDFDGGYLKDPVGTKNKIKAVVDAAVANDMYVVISWHIDHPVNYQVQAMAFFKEMATAYGNLPNVIYEINGEPGGDEWEGMIKPYSQTLVDVIRQVDADNLIIVGAPVFGTAVDIIPKSPVKGTNIAYGMNVFANFPGHGQELRAKAQYALSQSMAVVVTEFNASDFNNPATVNQSEAYAWADFMKQNRISNTYYAVSDVGIGSSILTHGASGTGGWTSNQLTANGAIGKDIVSHWPAVPSCTYVPIPATIEAESYCTMGGVQTEQTTDVGGGKNVGWIDVGDWMTYSIDVPTSGIYKLSYRVARATKTTRTDPNIDLCAECYLGDIRLSLEPNINDALMSTTVPLTGAWQNWVTTPTQLIYLRAGKQNLLLKAQDSGININWMKIEANTPDNTPAQPIATIQAENWAVMKGVQTESTSDVGGGLNVGWIDAGDWLSYTNNSVNVPATGSYTVEFRVASQNGGGVLSFEEAGGASIYSLVNIPSTNGWQNWTTIKATVNLTAGQHNFGIAAKSGGWNINWFSITKN